MDKKLVFPGTFLSAGEEYLAGHNAFENHDGNVYSAVVGSPVFDNDQKVVNVVSHANDLKLIDAGTIVFGKIELVKDSMIFVEVLEAHNNGEPRKVNGASAVLAVFNVQNSYVDSLSDLFKVGDIIKARVMGVNAFNIELETKSSPSFGIVKGYCAKCRVPIKMLDNGFKCPQCAMAVSRKFSSDYLVK